MRSCGDGDWAATGSSTSSWNLPKGPSGRLELSAVRWNRAGGWRWPRSSGRESPRFLFFKQKTAYEMLPRLEFRRVLFRSAINTTLRLAIRRRVVLIASVRAFESLRSEERRVGEECRSRRSPYH